MTEFEALKNRFEQSISKKGIATCWLDMEEVEELFNFYVSHFMYGQAQIVYDTAKRLHPDDEFLVFFEVRLHLIKGKFKAALELLERNQQTDEPAWYYYRMQTLLELSRPKQADQTIQQLYSLEGSEEIIKNISRDIADNFYSHHQYKYALKHAERQLEREPDNIDLLMIAANCYAQLDKPEKALDITDKVIDINPYFVQAWLAQAGIYSSLNRWDEALDAFDYALAIDPTQETIIIFRIKTLHAAGRDDEALLYITEMEKEQPHMQQTFFMLRGDIYYHKNDFKEAYKNYQKGFDKAQFIYDSTVRYMYTTMELGKYRKALKLAQFLFHIFPLDGDLLLAMSDCYYELHDAYNALRVLKKATQLWPDNDFYLVRYGSLCLDCEDYKTAFWAFHKVHRRNPQSIYALVMMIVTYYLRGDINKAIHLYQKFVKGNTEIENKLDEILPEFKKLLTPDE